MLKNVEISLGAFIILVRDAVKRFNSTWFILFKGEGYFVMF